MAWKRHEINHKEIVREKFAEIDEQRKKDKDRDIFFSDLTWWLGFGIIFVLLLIYILNKLTS